MTLGQPASLGELLSNFLFDIIIDMITDSWGLSLWSLFCRLETPATYPQGVGLCCLEEPLLAVKLLGSSLDAD